MRRIARPGGTVAHPGSISRLEEYVRSLELDAYVVGGAVRDELLGVESKDADFLVPGVDTEELKARLAPHTWLRAHLADRERCNRAHRSPAAGERAVNERRVEPPSVSHRQKLGVQGDVSSADAPRQFLRAWSSTDSQHQNSNDVSLTKMHH